MRFSGHWITPFRDYSIKVPFSQIYAIIWRRQSSGFRAALSGVETNFFCKPSRTGTPMLSMHILNAVEQDHFERPPNIRQRCRTSSKHTLRSHGPVSTCSESSISRTRSFRIRLAFFPQRIRLKSPPKIGAAKSNPTRFHRVSKSYRFA